MTSIGELLQAFVPLILNIGQRRFWSAEHLHSKNNLLVTRCSENSESTNMGWKPSDENERK